MAIWKSGDVELGNEGLAGRSQYFKFVKKRN